MHNNNPLLSLLGFRPTGDLAGLTAYTSRRGKVVWFPKSPPKKPPSFLQRMERDRFKAIAASWRRLTQEQRNAWSDAARGSHIFLSGYTLFLVWQSKRDVAAVRTIERLSGVNLLDT